MATNISKIKELINSYGTCIVLLDSDKKDYLFNGKDPFSYDNNFFKDAVLEFNQLIAKQLVEKKFDKIIAKKFSTQIKEKIAQNEHISAHRRVNFLLDEKNSSDNLTQKKVHHDAKQSHDRILEILRVQKNALYKMKSFVDELSYSSGYILEEDIKNIRSKVNDSDESSIELPNIGKMHIDLGKKDTITLITLLEQLGIVSFSNTSRNKFIEANLTCKSRDSKPSDIVKMNSDLSNLFDTSGDLGPRNKASFNKLVELLQQKLDGADYKSFAEWLKNSI